jgi:cell division protein FtsB
MNKETLRNYLIRDKSFLRELYEGEGRLKNNRILTFASDSKLNTLIRLLHFIANGEIKIKRVNFDVIQANKKLKIIKKTVEKRAAVNRLLQSERENKLKFLKSLSGIFSALLYCLFNES